MYLDFSPAPSFFACATKRFAEGEEHVTRRFGKSVLILMLENELAFREDGREIRLSPCEYYIQREGLFQEGLPMQKPPTYFFMEFYGHYSEDGELPLRGAVLSREYRLVDSPLREPVSAEPYRFF